MDHIKNVGKRPHHDREELCQTRPKYRQGKKLTAVKVYTVNDESKYLIVNGVPAIGLQAELERTCSKYGNVDFVSHLTDYPSEEYTEVFLVKYMHIKSARFGKVQLDGKSFYGSVLHVCYGPELESVKDTREKLQDRRKTIAALTKDKFDPGSVLSHKQKNKFHHDTCAKRKREPRKRGYEGSHCVDVLDVTKASEFGMNVTNNAETIDVSIKIAHPSIDSTVSYTPTISEHRAEKPVKVAESAPSSSRKVVHKSTEKKKLLLYDSKINLLGYKK
ncbi:RNA-binding protein 48 [Oratosquilla oratoria]|uniref:RNA-binding protein 48 n=1 Tax=Oratosquilla oratoria TaxID=337810 RepID=UPI003F76BC28